MSLLLNVEQLSVKLQDKTILSDLELSLNSGDILGLVGASGCGKTTLLNTIAGFVQPSCGEITINERIIVGNGDYIPAEKRQIGVIFQDYALFPHLTVRQNIAFGITKLAKTEQEKRIGHLLTILKLTPLSDKHIHQLSGGQQQRVAIARALAPQPKLLLLDEPFSNIDARLRNELMLEIRQLLKTVNTTAIFVTHNKDEVFTFADKMAVMAEGKLLQLDSPSVICEKPNSYQVADFLQLGSWLPCVVDDSHISTILGKVERSESMIIDSGKRYCLLLKSKYLSLQTEFDEPNAQVEGISVTEQGYHYLLSGISSELSTKGLHFDKLSFYCEDFLQLKQKISLSIKNHEPLVYCID
jgi:iron(III) transport system ATP-binding protein